MWTIKASYKSGCIPSQLVHKNYIRGDKMENRNTFKQLACEFGMEEPLEDLLIEYCLRWLGHLGRM